MPAGRAARSFLRQRPEHCCREKSGARKQRERPPTPPPASLLLQTKDYPASDKRSEKVRQRIRQMPPRGDFVAVPSRIVYRLPDSLSFEEAAMLEAVSVAVHAVSLPQISPGSNERSEKVRQRIRQMLPRGDNRN